MSRKEYTYHYIYKTVNIITEKFYIGMHSTFNLDDEYLGSGKYLWRSIKKYGRENHKKEILEFCKDRNELKKREKEIVNENFIKNKMCMNLQVGGEGGFSSNTHQKKALLGSQLSYRNRLKNDIEFRNKIKKIHSKQFKKLNKEGKLKHRDWTGRKHTQETINKMKTSHIGKHIGKLNSQYGKCWICNIKLKQNKKILNTNLIPNGWIKGRKIFK